MPLRHLMTLTAALLFAPVTSSLEPCGSLPCECQVTPTVAQERRDADFIFVGEIIQVDTARVHFSFNDRPWVAHRVTVEVRQAWKGVLAFDTLLFTGWSNCSAFSYAAAPGQRWLVFGTVDRDVADIEIEYPLGGARIRPDSLLGASVCGHTTDADNAAEILKMLGPPSSGRRP